MVDVQPAGATAELGASLGDISMLPLSESQIRWSSTSGSLSVRGNIAGVTTMCVFVNGNFSSANLRIPTFYYDMTSSSAITASSPKCTDPRIYNPSAISPVPTAVCTENAVTIRYAQISLQLISSEAMLPCGFDDSRIVNALSLAPGVKQFHPALVQLNCSGYDEITAAGQLSLPTATSMSIRLSFYAAQADLSTAFAAIQRTSSPASWYSLCFTGVKQCLDKSCSTCVGGSCAGDNSLCSVPGDGDSGGGDKESSASPHHYILSIIALAVVLVG